MDSSISGGGIIAPVATKSSSTEFALPDRSWDESRLLDYMRQHDKAIAGLERSTLQHEYCFGAAAQLKYEQLGGKWTQWAKDQGYPKETFRRRRLLFVRAGGIDALDKFPGKMEAYYHLGIYRKPTQKKLNALDARWESKAEGHSAGVASSASAKPEDTGMAEPDHRGHWPQTDGDDNEETLDALTAPIDRPAAITAAEILGQIGNLLMRVEEVGPDDSCQPLIDDIAGTVARLREALGRKGAAA